jgi:hypothetical protein
MELRPMVQEQGMEGRRHQESDSTGCSLEGSLTSAATSSEVVLTRTTRGDRGTRDGRATHEGSTSPTLDRTYRQEAQKKAIHARITANCQEARKEERRGADECRPRSGRTIRLEEERHSAGGLAQEEQRWETNRKSGERTSSPEDSDEDPIGGTTFRRSERGQRTEAEEDEDQDTSSQG